MKKLILLITLGLGLSVATKAQTTATSPVGEFKFEEETHNFGKITLGKPVTYVFTFTNAGNAPIIVSNAEASCGCTKPTFSTAPVKPGDKGTISVTFNAAAGPAPFAKTVTVTSNAKTPVKVLYIKGETVNQTSSK